MTKLRNPSDMQLSWPLELATDDSGFAWSQPLSNLCLDFHGDPSNAELVVFSDGNHHMALTESLRAFQQQHRSLNGIFYATTPPAVVVNLFKHGQLRLGNLILRVSPHVFISPAPIFAQLHKAGLAIDHVPFMQSRGIVLLVRHGNPKQIRNIGDLRRDDIRLFISNPQQESASYQVYAKTLQNFAKSQGWRLSTDSEQLRQQIALLFGEQIHHREAPQALYDGRADAAVLYYHLALRYTRIFPNQFTIMALDQQQPAEPIPDERQEITTYHVGLVDQGGKWGAQLQEFLLSDTVTAIYKQHGLNSLT